MLPCTRESFELELDAMCAVLALHKERSDKEQIPGADKPATPEEEARYYRQLAGDMSLVAAKATAFVELFQSASMDISGG